MNKKYKQYQVATNIWPRKAKNNTESLKSFAIYLIDSWQYCHAAYANIFKLIKIDTTFNLRRPVPGELSKTKSRWVIEIFKVSVRYSIYTRGITKIRQGKTISGHLSLASSGVMIRFNPAALAG